MLLPHHRADEHEYRAHPAVLVGSQGSEQAAKGVASYYHPEGGAMLSSQGMIRSMHRSEGSLSLEFATQGNELRSGEHPGSGLWPVEAMTTIEGSGRHEVINMTPRASSSLPEGEVSGVLIKEFIPDKKF